MERSTGTPAEQPEPITWDHPLIVHGIVPGYLLQQLLGYSDSYWKKWLADHRFLCKSMNGQQYFSLPAVERWLASPTVLIDESDD